MKSGRPKQNDNVDARGALIAAAQELFLRHDFDHVSTRQIANQAGVNSALIAYYFGNKLGLFQNALKELMAPVSGLLGQSLKEPSPVFLVQLLVLISERMPADLARLMLRTLLSDNQQLKQIMIKELAGPLNKRMRRVLVKLQSGGSVRDHFDPKLLSFLVAALMVFPLAMRPVAEELLEISLSGENLNRLTQTQIELLLRGITVSSQ